MARRVGSERAANVVLSASTTKWLCIGHNHVKQDLRSEPHWLPSDSTEDGPDAALAGYNEVRRYDSPAILHYCARRTHTAVTSQAEIVPNTQPITHNSLR
jgi:hypothetical protein